MAVVALVSEVFATITSVAQQATQRATKASLDFGQEITSDVLTAANHIRLGLQASIDIRKCRSQINDHPETVSLVKDLLFINGCFQFVIPVLFLFGVQPVLLSLFPDDSVWRAAFNRLTLIIFPLLWMVPVYVIALGLNFLKRKSLAERVITAEKRGPAIAPVQLVVDLVSETLILLVVSMQAIVFGLVPYVGIILSIVINCCLNSFVLFDYRLMSIGVLLPGRVSLINRAWMYFVGFGLPLTILSMLPSMIGCTFITAYVLSTAIYECAFPWLVILASSVSTSRDIPKTKTIWIPATVSIFQWADQITNDVCHWLLTKLGFKLG